jgi:hypothetical protein
MKHKKDEVSIVESIKTLSQSKYDIKWAIWSLFGVNHNDKYFCSEAVADILGLSRLSSLRSFTPDDLAERCDTLDIIE